MAGFCEIIAGAGSGRIGVVIALATALLLLVSAPTALKASYT